MMRKLILSTLGALAAATMMTASANAAPKDASHYKKGDIIVTDFGRVVDRQDINKSVRADGGRLLSKKVGIVNDAPILIKGTHNDYYFIRVDVHTGELTWIAPTSPGIVARFKG
ncbi:MAG: hypothetical protein AAGD92_14155 [Pseudomonadota bacterium]